MCLTLICSIEGQIIVHYFLLHRSEFRLCTVATVTQWCAGFGICSQLKNKNHPHTMNTLILDLPVIMLVIFILKLDYMLP